MKYLRMIVIGALLVTAMTAFGQINYRITMQSNIQTPGGENTLTVRTACKSPIKDYDILYHKFAFDMGWAMNTVLSKPLEFTHTTFTAGNGYTIVTNRTLRIVECEYTNTSGGITTGINTWKTVADVTFKYPFTGGLMTTFAWDDVLFTENNAVIGPWSVTVNRLPIPEDLQDLSLPVQMQDFNVSYSYEEGNRLEWTTQSEQDLKGFNVLRSQSEDGEYIQVSQALIPGQGNSSTLQDYVFVDNDVEWGATYYYKLHEVSILHGDTSKTYFGPVLGTTDKAPTEFHLSNNSPNPFNPSTEIQFEITESSIIDLSVYNLMGQKVATLVNEERPAGIYRVPWFGRDDAGNELSSGVYLYRLMTSEGTAVKKMMKVE